MKEKLTLRNIIIVSAAFLGLLVFCLSFAAKGFVHYDGMDVTIFNCVWHPAKIVYTDGIHVETMILKEGQYAIFALPLIGAILALVAGIGAVVVAIVIKDKKVSMIALIVCGVLAITGGVFMFFVRETAFRTLLMAETGSIDNIPYWKQKFIEIHGSYSNGALAYILGVMGILAGAALGAAPFLPEKKLAK